MTKYADLDQARQVIGADAFNSLNEVYRGCILYVPRRANKSSKSFLLFKKVIGTNKTKELIAVCGGDSIYFKKFRSEQVLERHARIAANYHGQLMADYAVECGVSIQRLYHILIKAGKIKGRLPMKEMAKRNAQIIEACKSEPVEEIAEKYGLSVSRVCEIMRAAER